MYESGSHNTPAPSIMREAGISSHAVLFFLLSDFDMMKISLADVLLKVKWLCCGFSFSVRLALLWHFQTEYTVEIEGTEDLIVLLIPSKNFLKPFAIFLYLVV